MHPDKMNPPVRSVTEKLGEIGDGKCRSRSDHQAIAEQKRELTAAYLLYFRFIGCVSK